jgi:PAS domain S-box-containing protein
MKGNLTEEVATMRFLRSSSSKVIWVLVFIFLIFSMAIGTAGYFFFQNQKRHLVQEKRDHLRSIADLKVGQIHNWRQERLAEATGVLENPIMISDWMVTQRKHLQYERVSLLDLKGTVRLSFPEGEEVLGPVTKRLASEAIREKRVILSEIYRGFNTGKIRLSLVVPILIRKGQDAFPVGVLLLRIDPDQFLYPLIQSWPTPSETSETLLVRRQGEEVEFLNELRHRKDTALSLRIPLSKKQVPGVMAVHGKETIEEGMDYRGVPVLAAMRRIPDSLWFIVAKVDQEEIYAPIRRSAWEIGIVTSLLIIGIGLSVGLASHQQRAQFYKRLYRAEQDRQALARHFDYLTKYANDIVLLMDEDLRIIEANNRTLETYGYTQEELMQLDVIELQAPEARLDVDVQIKQVKERNGYVFETLHQRKDGTTFPVESSSRVIEIEGRRFYQSIIRNITERKRAEEALLESEEKFRGFVENLEGIAVRGNMDGKPEFLLGKLEDITGYIWEDFLKKGLKWLDIMHPDDKKELVEKGLKDADSGKPIEQEYRIVRKDGGIRWVSQHISPHIKEDGTPEFLQGTIMDITERKRAEEALRERDIRFKKLSSHAPGMIYQFMKRPDGTYCVPFTTEAIKDIFGCSPQDVREDFSPIARVILPEDFDRIVGSIEYSAEHLTIWQCEYRVQIPGQSIRWMLGQSTPEKLADGSVIWHGFNADITERKRAEEELRKKELFNFALFEHNPIQTVAVDLEGKVTVFNLAKKRSGDRLPNIGDVMYKDYAGEHESDMYGELMKCIRSGEKKEFPEQKYGDKVLSITISPFPKGAVIISQDITERKRVEEALRENEVRYRELFENTNSGVAVYQVTGNGQDFIFKDFNRAGEKIDHDQRERLIGKSIFEVRPGVEQFGLIEALRQVWQTGEPGYHPVTLYQDDQLSGWYENFIYKLPSGEIMVVFENVTERKQAEEALRQSEERFRSVFNNAFVGMAIVNPEGHVVEANEAFCRFLEYSREEIIGRHFTECTHPEDLNIDSDLYATLLEDERLSYSIDKRYMCKGEVIWGRLSVSLVKDEAGEPENTIVVREDITERKQAEEALRGGEEKYRLLVENANEAIFVAQEERLKFVNRKVLEILGCTQEEITSKPFSDFIHPEDREMVLDNYLRGLRGETVPSIYDFRVIDKDGNVRWVELGTVKIDWEGKPATLNFGTDITERKRAEGEMGLLQEQFRHLQKMEAVGRLAGGVAHDFNNLLTVIRGYSELCLGKLEEVDPLWRKVKGIQRASERGARLTNQLLAFSRHQAMEMKVINLRGLFKDLDRMLRRVIGEDIELVTILAEDLGGMKADLGQTEQVIMNLVVNARDAMPKGGKLTIEAKNVELDDVFFGSHAGGEPGRYVMFSVSDTGFGMTPEVKEHIFEPFFTTKERGKGTGLGLSTVYGIVKQSGGEITVESEVGKGSVFRIYLPLVEGVMEEQKEEEQGAWGGKETVLVVEDEENVRRLVAEVLEGQGYEVLEASGGEEALQIMEGYGGRVDLILTDVVMPGMSGRELGKRSVERWGMVKVLYISGFFDEERVPLNVLEEGMNYVQKPFTIDALTRKVREVLDK